MNFKHTIDCDMPLGVEVFFWTASVVMAVVSLVMLTNYMVNWIVYFKLKNEQEEVEEQQEPPGEQKQGYSELNNPFIKAAKTQNEKR